MISNCFKKFSDSKSMIRGAPHCACHDSDQSGIISKPKHQSKIAKAPNHFDEILNLVIIDPLQNLRI